MKKEKAREEDRRWLYWIWLHRNEKENFGRGQLNDCWGREMTWRF